MILIFRTDSLSSVINTEIKRIDIDLFGKCVLAIVISFAALDSQASRSVMALDFIKKGILFVIADILSIITVLLSVVQKLPQIRDVYTYKSAKGERDLSMRSNIPCTQLRAIGAEHKHHL